MRIDQFVVVMDYGKAALKAILFTAEQTGRETSIAQCSNTFSCFAKLTMRGGEDTMYHSVVEGSRLHV